MAKRRNKGNGGIILTMVALVCIIGVAAVVIYMSGNSEPQEILPSVSNAPSSSEVTEPVEAEFEPIKVNLYAVGDNLYHESVIIDGETVEDYKSYYSEIADDISGADIAFVNQETVIAGEELGIGGYPIFNAPDNVGTALVELGFDVVNQASNHTMDKGVAGIENTIEFWNQYPEVTMIGMYNTEADRDNITLVESNGVEFAFLTYTYGLNGYVLPEDKGYMTNLIDSELIKSDIQVAKKFTENVIVSMHWGGEYSMNTTAEQQNLSQIMADEGVLLVLGHHSHVLGPVEWVEGESGNKTLVYYSLGNLVHSMEVTNCMLGAAAHVEFTADEEGVATITNASAEPIINHYVDGKKGFKVYPLSEYTDTLAAEHGIKNFDRAMSVSDMKNISESVLGEFYTDDVATSGEVSDTVEGVGVDSSDWKLVLLNKQNSIEGEFPVDLTLISGNYDIPSRDNMSVDSRIVDEMIAMFEAAKADGINLYLRSAHRTYELQNLYYTNTYDSWINSGKTPEEAKTLTDEYLAYPGTSEHHTGLAIDITTTEWEAAGGALTAAFDQTDAFIWLSENAADYGFILRYPLGYTDTTGYGYEPWHYRYVGVDTAKYMIENDISTLEDLLLD